MNKEALESVMKEMMMASSEIIFQEDIDEASFNLCVDTIIKTITYLRSKRKNKMTNK